MYGYFQKDSSINLFVKWVFTFYLSWVKVFFKKNFKYSCAPSLVLNNNKKLFCLLYIFNFKYITLILLWLYSITLLTCLTRFHWKLRELYTLKNSILYCSALIFVSIHNYFICVLLLSSLVRNILLACKCNHEISSIFSK